MKNFSEYIFESSLESKMRQRIEDHIERVKFFYNKMVELGIIPESDLTDINEHDKDKLLPKNLKRQALRFKSNLTKDEESQINAVIREHVRNNPHHCEYWGAYGQDHLSTDIHVENMPDVSLYEMIADWHATAEEKGNSVMEYFNKVNGKRYIFSKRQQKIIKDCAKQLSPFFDIGRKRQYSDTYLDPAQAK